MHFTMPPAPLEVKNELENLFAEWKTMEKTAPYTDFIDFPPKAKFCSLARIRQNAS